MQTRHVLSLQLLSVILLCACKGIGAPIVDHKDIDRTKSKDSFCGIAPSCTDDAPEDLAAQLAPLDTTTVDVASCGLVQEGCPDPQPPTYPGQPPALVSDCIASWTATTAPTEASGRSFDCTTMAITVDDKYDRADAVTLGAVDLQRTNLSITAKRATIVVLDGASLNDVAIDLHGPITLRITQSRMFNHVRISNARSDGTVARLELTGVDGDDLSVSGVELWTGQVAIKTSTIGDTRIVADEITLDDAALAMSSLRSSSLDSNHAAFDHTTLAFEHGRLEAPSATHTVISECGTLSVITGVLSSMRIAACSEDAVRIYGASAEKVYLDGAIQADHTLFENTIFGAHEKTDLVAWDSQVFASSFCKYSSTARLGASVFLLCPACDEADRFIACIAQSSMRKIEVSQCPQFKTPEPCGNALPDRPRPPS